MNKLNDLTRLYVETAMNFVPNPATVGDAFRKSAEFGERMSSVAIKAAQGSADVTGNWTAETLNQLGAVSASKEDAAEYVKAAGEFASKSVETATQQLTALAEVAKNAQIEMVEATLAAGK